MKTIYLIFGAIVAWLLIVTVGFFVLAILAGLITSIHDTLMARRWYRVGYSTLTYPLIKRKVKRAWLLKTDEEIINSWTEYSKGESELVDSGTWYQKRLERCLIKNFIEPALERMKK